MIRFLQAVLMLTFLILPHGCAEPGAAADSADSIPMVDQDLQLADPNVSEADREIFERVMTKAREASWKELTFDQILIKTAESFLGTPYVEGSLDRQSSEELVVNLAGFDCVTYVESVMAIARGIKTGDYSIAGFATRLEEMRYRGGQRDGYASRLHYFTEWIADNARRDLVEDVTAAVGGVDLEKQLNFMGTHRSSYPKLVDSDQEFDRILKMEASLAGHTLFYVPQANITSVYPELSSGDIIATSASVKGLDVTHTGFAWRDDSGGIGFIHASSTGEVKVAEDLATYVKGNRIQTGIIIARPTGS